MRSRLKWHFSDSAASRSCDVFLNRVSATTPRSAFLVPRGRHQGGKLKSVSSNYSFTELSILDQLRH
jgi:hypothetical protein